MVPTYNNMRERESNAENSTEKSVVNFKSLWEVRTGHLGKPLAQTSVRTGPEDGAPVRRPTPGLAATKEGFAHHGRQNGLLQPQIHSGVQGPLPLGLLMLHSVWA